MRGILEHLDPQQAPLVITDMEAGLEHLKRGTLEHADVLLIIVEPYYKALDTAGRIADLARSLGVPRLYAVANKVQSVRDDAAIREFCATKALPVVAVVPFDAEVAEAERQGQAPFDRAPDAPAVATLRELARQLVAGVTIPGDGATVARAEPEQRVGRAGDG